MFPAAGLGLQRYLRLPYSLDGDRLVEAAGRLAAAWERVAGGTVRPAAGLVT